MKTTWLVLACMLPAIIRGASFSGQPTLNTNSPPIFSKLEISVTLGDSYSNPYDDGMIAVDAKFNAPDNGVSSIPCFWYQPYAPSSGNSWSTSGSAGWLCRFTPAEVGDYKFEITATDSNGSDSISGTFSSVNSSLPGFIHRSAKDNRYLIRSNTNETYFAIGENIAWWNNGIHDYDTWVGRVAAAGGNYFRLWIGATKFGFAIEENLGDYDSTQEKAAWLDYLVEMAESKEMTILMCINFHGDFSTTVNSNWGNNPYNQNNGGPLSDPQYVWTDGTTIQYFQRRYRYIIARWAYSTSVHAWELWNEMDWIDNYANNVQQAAAWHQQFVQLIHQNDPFGHVITTSFAEDKNNQPVDQAVDYTQIHQYNVNDFAESVNGYIPAHVSTYNSPCWMGEMGVSWESGQSSEQEDPNGISLHNVQWASLVMGAAGGGFSWWWDSYVDPLNLYGVFTGISQFLVGETLDSHQYTTVQPSVNSGYLRSWALSGGDGYVLGWVQAQAHTWSNVNNGGGIPTVPNAQVQLSCSNSDKNNTLEIWNTVSGARISYNDITCSGGNYVFTLPQIDGNNPDYGFKIYPGGPQNHTNPPTSAPTPPPSNNLPDWAFCTTSSQCADGCCSKQYSGDGKLKCTPGGTPSQCVNGGGSNLPDWDFCSSSSQCADGCCSNQYSGDGKYKCTPNGTQCI